MKLMIKNTSRNIKLNLNNKKKKDADFLFHVNKLLIKVDKTNYNKNNQTNNNNKQINKIIKYNKTNYLKIQ